MSFFFIYFSLLLSSPIQAQKAQKNFGQKISLKMTFTGDLNEVYQFDGFVGEILHGETENQNPLCKNTATFRNALYRNRKSLEVWIHLICTIEGQKSEYKPHRFFIDPSQSEQNLNLPAQSEKFKKIRIQISELEVKTKKSK